MNGTIYQRSYLSSIGIYHRGKICFSFKNTKVGQDLARKELDYFNDFEMESSGHNKKTEKRPVKGSTPSTFPDKCDIINTHSF